MRRRLTGIFTVGGVALGLVIGTAATALAHDPWSGDPGLCTAAPEGVTEHMGSMMGSDSSGMPMDPEVMGSMMRMMMGWMDSDSSGMPMDAEDMGSMMRSQAQCTLDDPAAASQPEAPVDEDAAADPVDHAAHHAATSPEPAE